MNAKTARAACAGTLLAALAASATAQPVPIDFNITDGQVVPTEDFATKISVLGAAIHSGSYDMPVTLEVRIGAKQFEPFGPMSKAVTGNVNDSSEHHLVINEVFDSGAAVTVTGTSWLRKTGKSGIKDSDWKVCNERSSHSSDFVMVLRDGDKVPDIEGFQDQGSVEHFVQQYVNLDTDRISLNEHQAIYLFELGTTDLDSPAADFQDLVVLLTLGHTPGEAGLNSVDALLAD